MAVRLSEVKAREKASQVTWDDDVVDFGYFPNVFTMDLAEQVQEAAEKGDLTVVSTFMEPVLSWWDVLDDDGRRLPTDAETMRQFPLGFIMAVMGQITEDQQNPPDSRG